MREVWVEMRSWEKMVGRARDLRANWSRVGRVRLRSWGGEIHTEQWI